jgi:hypothetical protein
MKRILVPAVLGLALAICACACAQARAGAPPAAPIAPAAAPAANAAAPAAPGEQTASAPSAQTIRGELVDLACYLDHGAKGEHHKACATSCALRGLPIGLLDKDNKVTIVIGEHDKPMNTELAEKMGTTVQLTGKIVSRDGLQMIEVSGVE